MVPPGRPPVYLQHPFWGDVSPLQPVQSTVYFAPVGTEARGGLQGSPEQGLRRCQRDATDARDAMLAPLHGRSRAAPEDDRQDTRRKGSEMGGWIGGRLGEVKREDEEARGGDDGEG